MHADSVALPTFTCCMLAVQQLIESVSVFLWHRISEVTECHASHLAVVGMVRR